LASAPIKSFVAGDIALIQLLPGRAGRMDATSGYLLNVYAEAQPSLYRSGPGAASSASQASMS
jgi:hypothetical protein